MRKVYWRPQRISLRVLAIVALAAVAGLVSVETFRVRERQAHYGKKVLAARLARQAFDVIKQERLQRAIPIDEDSDPARTGLIGSLLTLVTTSRGHLPAKQTSVNPNFAAVVVHMLKRAGVEEGDAVAVGFSGSFPAINVNVMAAMEAIGVRPLIISSAGASQWGANDPDFMWTDMEKVLADRRVFSFRSLAATRGGVDDRALGLTKDGRQHLDLVIQRSGLPQLDVKNFTDSVEKRFAFYQQQAGDTPIRAYINVGGGTSSVGTRVGKRMFRPGLNRRLPRGASTIDSVMTRFVAEGVPVIHLSQIDNLAIRHGLPVQPTVIPAVGEGKVFIREVYQTWLVAVVLIALIGLLFAFVRFDWGYRLLATGRRERSEGRPEPMV